MGCSRGEACDGDGQVEVDHGLKGVQVPSSGERFQFITTITVLQSGMLKYLSNDLSQVLIPPLWRNLVNYRSMSCHSTCR